MELTLQLLTEPKVFLAAYANPCKIDLAEDDQGNSLLLPPEPKQALPPSMDYLRFPGVDKLQAVQTGFLLKYPPAPAKSIKRLRGSITVAVGMDLHTVDLTPVLH